MVDAAYDAAFPKGRRVGRSPTYLERELGVRGRLEVGFGAVKDRLTITVRGERIEIECVCPAHPHITAMGCPLHHYGPGGSWPVEHLKAALTTALS